MTNDSRKQNMTKKECENNGHCCKMTAANFIGMLQLRLLRLLTDFVCLYTYEF